MLLASIKTVIIYADFKDVYEFYHKWSLIILPKKLKNKTSFYKLDKVGL